MDMSEQFAEKLSAIDQPRKLLVEVCKQVGRLVDFCCFMRISDDLASGWIFYSNPPLPDFDIGSFTVNFKDEPSIRRTVEEKIPVSLEDLKSDGWTALLERRGMEEKPACTFFPMPMGERIPFLFFVDHLEKFDAKTIGRINQWVTAAGMRMSALILKKRRGGEVDPPPEAGDAESTSPLMGINWASAYSIALAEGNRNKSPMLSIRPLQPHQRDPFDIQLEFEPEELEAANAELTAFASDEMDASDGEESEE